MRPVGLKALKGLLADHFVGETTILQAGGYKKAAAIVINSLPSNKQVQSGDLGELLATEYLNAETAFVVPIKKLRWKSDRETAMHGNDVIGVDATMKPVRVLKGECKSRGVSAIVLPRMLSKVSTSMTAVQTHPHWRSLQSAFMRRNVTMKQSCFKTCNVRGALRRKI